MGNSGVIKPIFIIAAGIIAAGLVVGVLARLIG